MKIFIVGGGIAGLSIAWRLAQAGAEVEVLERGIAGRGATWASAGMIAPGAELGAESSAMAAFAERARAAWPSFAADVEAASGMPVYYKECGCLLVAATAERAATLQAAACPDSGAVWLTREELLHREPLLDASLLGALQIATDAQVDNRALAEALRAAAMKAGARLRERCSVRSVLIDKGRVSGVIADDGVIAGDIVVLSGGAWMGLLEGMDADVVPPVQPVKGQMAACEPPPGTVLPQSLIWSESIYLVPRHNRLFIGATVENAGFDTSVTHEARDWLLDAAARVIPSLRSWRVAELWAGLRPRTPDHAPVLGTTSIDGLLVAGGQFRNGILFAPVVGETISRAILQNSMSPDLSAFDPKRFAKSA